jgi:hypothetical protein
MEKTGHSKSLVLLSDGRMVKKVRRRAMALKRSGPGMDSTKFSVESVCIKRRVGEEMAAGDRSTWGRRGYKVP